MSAENEFGDLSEEVMTEMMKRAFRGESEDAIVADVLPRTDASETAVREFLAQFNHAKSSIARGVMDGVRQATAGAVSNAVDQEVKRQEHPQPEVERPRWASVLLVIVGVLLGAMSATPGDEHAGASIAMACLGISCLIYGIRLWFWRPPE